MSGFFATGGCEVGGQGLWGRAAGRRCKLLLNFHGLTTVLNQFTTFLTFWYKCGLYSNDREPGLTDTLANYSPATFSGYTGEALFQPWQTSTLVGERAQRIGQQFTWTHNGGPVDNWIFGYYVLDSDGLLVWAERFCNGPFAMDRAGRSFNLTPLFTTKNEDEG